MNLLSALTRQLPQEDQPFEIHHDGKRIPIKLKHLGAKVSKIAISVDPPSIVINQDNPFYMGGISKNAAWFIACNQYAAYVISGPFAWEQAQQNMDYLQSAIAWDKPELNPDGSIKRMSGDLPDGWEQRN